jgi:RND family efflux transporter MFP subunit
MRRLDDLLTFGTASDLTDGQLLERFATLEKEAAERAFVALLERHGPMVLRVCRTVLDNSSDIEDAFQATFLVLVRKARFLWVDDSLGPWLHQVALRTAAGARAAAARRKRHEQAAAVSTRDTHMESTDELGPLLHEEIERLPERFRVPVVLCDLEGSTHEQAARHLGWPVGTVKSRLTRARERLRDRLTRRGLAPGSCLIGLLRPPGFEERVPAALLASTTSSALRFAASATILKGSAAILAQGVLRAMFKARWLKIASVMVLSASTVSGLGVLAWSRGQAIAGSGTGAGVGPGQVATQDVPLAPVRSGKFKLAVVERGSLEAARSNSVFSQVEGQTTILSIVPEGTAVKKGQLICELDSAALRDQLVNQRITTMSAQAAYQNARLTREVAEIAVKEYTDGIYVQDRATIQGELKLAQSDQMRAKDKLELTRHAHQKLTDTLKKKNAPMTSGDILAELEIVHRLAAGEHDLLRETLAVEKAQSRLFLLENYTKGKTIKELSSEVEKLHADEVAKQQRWELEKAKEVKLERMIAACKIYAPADGVIVRANNPFRTGGPVLVEENATVRERQKLVSIVDFRSPLQVNAKIHESMIDRLTPGQKARIQVDAFADEKYTGVVTELAPLPDPLASSRGTKVFSAKVRLDQTEAKLRPGMNAQVTIPYTEREGIIMVPRSALLHFDFDNKDLVKVKKPDGGFESREVVPGDLDETATLIEIKQGLKPGEQVATSPLALLNEQERTKRDLGRQVRPTTGRPAE